MEGTHQIIHLFHVDRIFREIHFPAIGVPPLAQLFEAPIFRRPHAAASWLQALAVLPCWHSRRRKPRPGAAHSKKYIWLPSGKLT